MAAINTDPPSLSDKSLKGKKGSQRRALQVIFSLLRVHSGHDFSHYKTNTICRRIERRMSACHISNIQEYTHFLETDESEVNILLNDLLIGVTSFFRDVGAYELLAHYIRQQIQRVSEGACLRVWVPACSSGEEAYSIAILLQECIDASNKNIDYQIFSSDIDGNAIKMARTGYYSSEILETVSAARLHRFFVKTETGYRINRDIRDHIVFAIQSLIKDPPFTRIDFLSCRNLLIYFSPKLQKKILPLFHYSLNPRGILFLGASESIGGFSEYFETLDQKNKIYGKKELEPFNKGKVKFPITTKNDKSGNVFREKPMIKTDVNEQLEQILVENCMPPCVITDKNGDIVYVHGSTGNFIEPAAGAATLNIVDMARFGLDTKLSYAIREVNSGNTPYIYRNLEIPEPQGFCFNLIVKRVVDVETERDFVIVIFEESNIARDADDERIAISQDDPRILELERELKYTKESLQSTIEELKSTNEELQSTNEELQSTNEELETSKEELVIVNAELEFRIEELTNINDDIKNLLDSTNIATIFLDEKFRIKRYTPKVEEIIRLIPGDVGRPVQDIVHNIEGSDFFDQVDEVVKTHVPVEREVKSKLQRWYYMRITPYKTISGVHGGVVLTFEDMTEIKRHRDHLELLVSERTAEIQEANRRLLEEVQQHQITESALIESESQFERLFKLNIMGIFFLDEHARLVKMNHAFSEMIGYGDGDLPMPIKNIVAGANVDALKKFEENITAITEQIYIHKNTSSIFVLQGGIALSDESRIFFIMDMTKQKRIEDELHRYQQKHANVTRFNTVGEMATGIAHEINQPLTNITNYIHGFQLRLKESELNKNELLSILEKINHEAKRSSAIVKNLRKLVHKKPREYEDVDANSIIFEVLKNQKKELDENQVQMETFLNPCLPKITMEAVQLEQILINLLNNALDSLKNVREKGRQILVRSDFDEKFVRISVEDNGEEIDVEISRMMFDLFYTTKASGLGMGLSISRSIIESYGGSLSYLSNSNQHNVFRIIMPINPK